VAVPLLEGIVAEQGMLEDALGPGAADMAVVLAPCFELLEASPGNCTAACGLTDGEALMPAAALADPTVVEPAAGAAVNDVALDEPAVNEPVFDAVAPDEPLSQLSAVERLPMNEPPDEQGVPARLAPLIVVAWSADEAVLDDVVVADVLVPVVVPPWEPVCETA
jgi:hypothetical protein